MLLMSLLCVLQTLIGRLKEFILRFNAQCDSLNPRPGELQRERGGGGIYK